jgi:hypothetical protein
MREEDVDIVAEWWYGLSVAGWIVFAAGRPATDWNLQRAGGHASGESDPIVSHVTQVAECLLNGHVVLVMHAHLLEPAERAALADAMRAQFGSVALIVPVLKASEGHALIDGSFLDVDEEAWTRAGAAVAVVNARWGWDESSQIVVEDGARSVEIEPSYDGTRWTARRVTGRIAP